MALGASVIAFGALALTRSFSDGRSATQATERIISGLSIATLAVAAVVFITILSRWLFQRGIRRLLLGRPDALMLEVVRNRRFTRLATVHGDIARVPLFLALVADRSRIEVWGGMMKPRIIWSSEWSNLSDLRVGAIFDGRQAYECLEFELRAPGSDLVQLVVTGRGLCGLGAIEGEPLQDMVGELVDLIDYYDLSEPLGGWVGQQVENRVWARYTFRVS